MATSPGVRRYDLTVGGRLVPLVVTKRPRARRLTMRVRCDGSVIAISIPLHASYDTGLRFALGRIEWISDRLAAIPARVYLAEHALVPIFGIERAIRVDADRGARVRLERDAIVVGGGAADVGTSVRRWLSKFARLELLRRASEKAERISRPAPRIRLGDPRSRWGSCSAKGTLSFSWRLILAPEFAMDYVVAHEVSHLKFHNHGADFWRLVAALSEDMHQGRRWIKREGVGLHRYG